MKTLAQIVGGIVLVLWLLGCLGLLDFYLCVGKPGTCIAEREGLTA